MIAMAVVMKVMVKFVSQMWPRSCRMLRVQCEFEYVLGHEAAKICLAVMPVEESRPEPEGQL